MEDTVNLLVVKVTLFVLPLQAGTEALQVDGPISRTSDDIPYLVRVVGTLVNILVGGGHLVAIETVSRYIRSWKVHQRVLADGLINSVPFGKVQAFKEGLQIINSEVPFLRNDEYIFS